MGSPPPTGVVRSLRERADALAHAMADGVLVHDPTGAIVDCNPAAERILGLAREEILGPSGREPARRATGVDRPPAVVTLIGDPQHHVLTHIRRPDGSVVWLDVSRRLLGDGPAADLLTTFTDVTDRLVHERERSSLRRLSALVASGADPTRVFEAVAEEATRCVMAQGAAVLRLDGGRSQARVVGAWRADGGAGSATVRVLAPDDLACAVARSAAPARLDVPEDGCVADRPAPAGAGRASSVAVPIMVRETVWGVLVVDSTEGSPLPPETEERLVRVAEIATLAAVGCDTRAQVAHLASSDPLTGLWNRDAFEDRLALELGRAERYGRGIGLVLLDLDDLRLINESYGTAVGDEVLVEFAARLRAAARSGEVVARVGGEEFGVILTEADGLQAMVASERLRRAVVVDPLPSVGRLKVTAGVCASEDAPSRGDLLRLAGVALHWAKIEGGDRVVRYSADTGALSPPGEHSRRLTRAKTFAGVEALARAVDARDPVTQRHSERVAEMARRLAIEIGWPADRADHLHQAAIVHDVGKIGIPDSLLFASRSLTPAERARVEDHAALGAAIIQDALSPEQVAWVRGHHERIDGEGYPDGLSGDDIPDGARVLALADAWDAMTVARPYGAPRSRSDAWAECLALNGRQFDPSAVAALGRLLEMDEALPARAPRRHGRSGTAR